MNKKILLSLVLAAILIVGCTKLVELNTMSRYTGSATASNLPDFLTPVIVIIDSPATYNVLPTNTVPPIIAIGTAIPIEPASDTDGYFIATIEPG